jgi:hypothetical protein
MGGIASGISTPKFRRNVLLPSSEIAEAPGSSLLGLLWDTEGGLITRTFLWEAGGLQDNATSRQNQNSALVN